MAKPFLFKDVTCKCAHLLLQEFQNYKSLLDPNKKRYPMSNGKGEAPQDGRRGKIVFRIKHHAHQRCSQGSNKNLCSPGDPTETEPDLPLSV